MGSWLASRRWPYPAPSRGRKRRGRRGLWPDDAALAQAQPARRQPGHPMDRLFPREKPPRARSGPGRAGRCRSSADGRGPRPPLPRTRVVPSEATLVNGARSSAASPPRRWRRQSRRQARLPGGVENRSWDATPRSRADLGHMVRPCNERSCGAIATWSCSQSIPSRPYRWPRGHGKPGSWIRFESSSADPCAHAGSGHPQPGHERGVG